MDLFREQLFHLSQCKRKARILLRVRFAQVERIETHKIRKLDVYDAHTDHPTQIYEIQKPHRKIDEHSCIADVLQNQTREMYKLLWDPSDSSYILLGQIFQNVCMDDWVFCGVLVNASNESRERCFARTFLIRDELMHSVQARSKRLHQSESCDPDEF